MSPRAAGAGALALAAVALAGCDDRPRPPTPLVIEVPANLGRAVPSPERNPPTVEGVALGERLFFDPRLSGDQRFSCASCHFPDQAFSDGRVRSPGASGERLLRHTPTLMNLAWWDGYFWDGGANDLESQVFGPLTSPDEMAQDPAALVAELSADPTYPAAFARAFEGGLRIQAIVRALAQYERTLIAATSRYDRFVRGEAGGALDAREQRGRAVFGERCAGCHATDFFTDFGYHNNGLDEAFGEEHERVAWGRGRITHEPSDIGKYKTPTLRNVAVTAPYMHDGRFATLEQVLAHYRTGVRPSPTLDARLAGGVAMSDADAEAIIAFLRTLTDARLVE